MPQKVRGAQLAFDAGPVPAFLQKLHADVNAGRAKLEDKRGGRAREEEGASEFDDLLGVGGSGRGHERERGGARSGAKFATTRDEDEDQEDDGEDWAGAQVVVLKDGKHLSAEEAQSAQEASKQSSIAQQQEEDARMSEKKEAAIASAGAASASRKRRAVGSSSPSPPRIAVHSGKERVTDDLGAAKDVIAAARAGHKGMIQKAQAEEAESAAEKQRRKEEKKKQEREQKNKRARAEKKKMGKGLSFDLED